MAQTEQGLQPRRRREPILRQASPLEEIRLSCLKGNLQSVERIIQAGVASVNDVFEDGWTALMVASNGAHPQIVQYLLEQHANPNICRPDGFSPLMAALTSSQREVERIEAVAELLLNCGAEINVQNKAGLSPVLLAIRDNKIPILRLLLSHGANVNSKDKDGRTPLFHAAERGFIDITRVLLENGADIHATDHSGKTSSEIAKLKGHLELANITRTSTSEKPEPAQTNVSPAEKPQIETVSKTEPEVVMKVQPVSIPETVPKVKMETKPQLETETISMANTLKQNTIEKSEQPANTPAVSNNLPKETDKKIYQENRNVSQPAEKKSSDKKGEKKNMLAVGLAFSVGVGVLILYYARVYYLKRN